MNCSDGEFTDVTSKRVAASVIWSGADSAPTSPSQVANSVPVLVLVSMVPT